MGLNNQLLKFTRFILLLIYRDRSPKTTWSLNLIFWIMIECDFRQISPKNGSWQIGPWRVGPSFLELTVCPEGSLTSVFTSEHD